MSAIISAFLTLILTLALSHGQAGENPKPLAQIEENVNLESEASAALNGNAGLEVAANAKEGNINSQNGALTPTSSPSPTPTTTPSSAPEQNPAEEEENTSLEAGIGADISVAAQSDLSAEVDESAQDNAGETHGQAVSAQAKSEVSTNLNLQVPALGINIGLGL